MIQIKPIGAEGAISISGTTYPPNSLVLEKKPKDVIAVMTTEKRLILEAPYTDFVNKQNIPYTSADDLIAEVESIIYP